MPISNRKNNARTLTYQLICFLQQLINNFTHKSENLNN